MKDRWGRTIDYLRLSLTDRCNLRCRYCMPDDVESVGHDAVLRYEEMMIVCKAALKLGIDRFKITGGEPLVRREGRRFYTSLERPRRCPLGNDDDQWNAAGNSVAGLGRCRH